MRAMSRFTARSLPWPSSALRTVAHFQKYQARLGRAPWFRSPLCVALLALDDACLEGQLVNSAGQRLASDGVGDTAELEKNATRLDVGNPPLDRTLAGTHAGFGRLLRERTVGVDVDPHLSATLDVTRHSDTSGLDLTVGHIRGGHRLDTVLAERHRGATGRLAGTARVVLLAVLDSTWNQHYLASTPAATGEAAAVVAGASTRGARRGRSSRRSGRDDLALACSRASSLLVMSPL